MATFIIGQGAMGSLVAHELRSSGLVAPTFLMKSKKALDVYANNGSAITVMRPSKIYMTSSSVPVEAIYGLESKLSGEEKIENLIIATKTYSTADALVKYLPRITKDTNIMFLQNGMGVVPKLKQKFWQNSWEVPNLYHAISTHGAYKTSPNIVHHVGPGSLLISRLPPSNQGYSSRRMQSLPENTSELIHNLTKCTHLDVTHVPYTRFLLKQMEKLVINACINPLTTAMDCLNGELLYAKSLIPTLNKVIGECVECFKKEFDVFAMGPEAGVILSRDRLLSSVLEVCRTTANNSSSMREDVRRLNLTEIDSINGYIVEIGYRRNIATPANRMLLDLVRNKLAIDKTKENQALHRSFSG